MLYLYNICYFVFSAICSYGLIKCECEMLIKSPKKNTTILLTISDCVSIFELNSTAYSRLSDAKCLLVYHYLNVLFFAKISHQLAEILNKKIRLFFIPYM